ncbi:polyprenol monophosphomannose synthase [candidate division WOR-3 bacterium]|nr:polyprenol monophosphomannose synthase [candidate division WOR-3 bacterium]
MMGVDSLVIIPTYNEKENIKEIIKEVLHQGDEFEILIVDDNSPDKTGNIVRGISKKDQRVHLIERRDKLGLGSAYIEGFKYALENDYEFIYEMDADFSHDPSVLPVFRKYLKEEGFDLAIGSRYKDGVNVVNWPMSRLILSYCANFFAKTITGAPISDLTSGFKGFRRKVLKSLNFDIIKADGYGFQIEVHFYSYRKNFRIKEVPIIFIDRRSGHSKMSKKIVWEAFWIVWGLGFRRLFRAS